MTVYFKILTNPPRRKLFAKPIDSRPVQQALQFHQIDNNFCFAGHKTIFRMAG